MTTKKYPQNLHTQNFFIFLKTPKNIEIQNFDPKNDPSLRMYENIRIPPPPPPGQRMRWRVSTFA